MMLDMFHDIEVRRLISPDEGAGSDTAKVSQIIDLKNTAANLIVIATGALADANATFAVLVEDGDDASLTDAAAVDDAYLIGTEAGAGFQFDDDDEVRKIAYIGPKRYLRVTITPTGNTGAWDIGAVMLLSHHRKGLQTSQS
jgi:hypothetical protein